ncbi:reverse transcriptase [Cucumis melo var. makuwa]|uniref:Reverse transcriptase n=1 Tax=Cucumis melo var. makuwa TaxID=1194695 RepID=A0A5D3CAX0_CUCMM|nr:reverse transcriptase [Cucumis melo var. makuwa]TYK08490.1 reverse transcriptase [Cucumis melo var. makuwa]
MSSRALHLQTPLECLKESYPSTCPIFDVPLWVFGCATYVHNHGPHPTKLIPNGAINTFIRLLSTSPTLVILPSPSPHGPHYEPSSLENLIKMSESDKSETTIHSVDTKVISDGKGSDGGNEVIAKVTENETREDRSKNINKYDPTLDLSIALRKGTRAFTTSLDSATIPKNIHVAFECPRKTPVMEEMRALEKNKTWSSAFSLRDKIVDANGCLLSSTKQMVLLTDIRPD